MPLSHVPIQAVRGVIQFCLVCVLQRIPHFSRREPVPPGRVMQVHRRGKELLDLIARCVLFLQKVSQSAKVAFLGMFGLRAVASAVATRLSRSNDCKLRSLRQHFVSRLSPR